MENKIKYHLNGTGEREYGADGKLTDNWNPDLDYGNEYVNVYFRTNAKKYRHGFNAYWKANERTEFYEEIRRTLEPLGWVFEVYDWGIDMDISKGKQHLYLHPDCFSGEVLKNEVKEIAEALRACSECQLEWVDLYQTAYDISDEEYAKYLEDKVSEIRSCIFNTGKTKRRDHYCSQYNVACRVALQVKLNRVGLKDGVYGSGGMTVSFVNKIIDEMVKEGYLIRLCRPRNQYLIRSLNRTEMKKAKLKEV